MLVAEHSDLVIKRHSANEKGCLPHNLGSYYNEFQIINNLGEDIFALDYRNQVVRIQPHEGIRIPKEEDRNITIQYRFTPNPRKYSNTGMEDTQSTRGYIIIPYSVLLREPVFVEELNAVIYSPRWHPSIIHHPHSKEYIQLEHDKIRAEIARNATYSPITIMANDPTGKVSKLYAVIDNKICSVKVTNFSEDDRETDTIVIALRESISTGEDAVRLIRTSFTELYRDDPLHWEIEGLQISKDREWLANKLNIAKSKVTNNVIPTEEVSKLIQEARISDQQQIKDLQEVISDRDKEIKTIKHRYGQLRDSYDDLIANGHMDRSSKVASKKLDIESEKVKATIHEADRAKEIEEIKKMREQLSTLGVVIKLAIAVVPLVLIYLKYKQAKT